MAQGARRLGSDSTHTSGRWVSGKCALPSVPPMAIERPRLLARLDEAVAHRLTVVRGPAGSGKTVLLAQWARAADRPLGWVTLDDADNDALRLWAVINAAVRRSRPDPDRPGVVALPAGRVERVTQLAAVLAGSPGPITLILDRFECLRAGPAIDVIEALLHLPGVRLVISGRGTPALPLSRWRLAGELVEVESDELAFTTAEAGRLWQMHGRFLADAQAQAVLTQTEGWAALVCLAAMTMDRHVERVWRDFIRTEVVGAQPPLVRDFLVRTSVVEAFCADLGVEIAGQPDSYRLLDQLHGDGILVSTEAPTGLDPPHREAEWFRCRAPVQQFREREATLTIGAELPGLRSAASRWLANRGAAPEALRQSLAAEDWPEAASLVVRFASPLLLGTRSSGLSDAGDRLSTVDAIESPVMAAALAVVAAGRDDVKGVGAFGALLLERLSPTLAAPDLPLWTALEMSNLVIARRHANVPLMRESADRVLRLLDRAPAGLVAGSRVLSAKAMESRGLAALWTGDMVQAETCLTDAATADTGRVAADAKAGLSVRALLNGRLGEAVGLAHAASARHAELDRGSRDNCELVLAIGGWLTSGSPSNRPPSPTIVDDPAEGPSRLMYLAGLARLAAADADLGRARGLLPDPKNTADSPRLVRDWVALAEAEVHLAASRPVHALTALSQQSYGRQDPLGAHARVMAARAYLASSAPARAASLLAPIHEWPHIGSWMRVEAWLVSALAADAQGHDGTVGIALAEALAAAAPDGVMAPFLSPSATALLDRHRDLLGVHPDFVTRLPRVQGRDRRAQSFPQPVQHNRPRLDRAASLPEPITTRETVVLRYLPTLLTMNDIARELSVSPNTVKSHLRHIYRKLDVGSRRDAVRQARRHGLLWD